MLPGKEIILYFADEERADGLTRVTCDRLSLDTPWRSLHHAMCAARCQPAQRLQERTLLLRRLLLQEMSLFHGERVLKITYVILITVIIVISYGCV